MSRQGIYKLGLSAQAQDPNQRLRTDLNYLRLGMSACCGHHKDVHDTHVGCLVHKCGCQEDLGEASSDQPIFRSEAAHLLGYGVGSVRLYRAMRQLHIRFRQWSYGPEGAISSVEFRTISRFLKGDLE